MQNDLPDPARRPFACMFRQADRPSSASPNSAPSTAPAAQAARSQGALPGAFSHDVLQSERNPGDEPEPKLRGLPKLRSPEIVRSVTPWKTTIPTLIQPLVGRGKPSSRGPGREGLCEFSGVLSPELKTIQTRIDLPDGLQT